MNGIEDNIDRLHTLENAHEAVDSEYESGFGKKKMRKIENIEESLEKFGKKQNEYNTASAEAVAELFEYCKRLEKEVDKEREACRRTATALSAVKKEFDGVRLRSALNSNQIEKFDLEIEKNERLMDDFILASKPSFRNSRRPKGCRESEFALEHGFYDKIEELRGASGAERTELLKKLEHYCEKTAFKDFSSFNAYDKICIGFFGKGAEAEVLLNNLMRKSIYNISNSGENEDINCFVCVSESLALPNTVSFKSGIAVITGTDPLLRLSDGDIENMLFLNDCGLHEYVVLNENAYNRMKEAGFRNLTAGNLEFISGTDIIELVEKAAENAVPKGAISFDLFREKALGKSIVKDFESLKAYYAENPERDITEQKEFLRAAESGILDAICSERFPGEQVKTVGIASESGGEHNVVTGFGYLNHLKYSERKKLYAKASEMLESGGVLVFSAHSAKVGIKLRSDADWNGYEMYEALWTKEQLLHELEENGFRSCFIVPIGGQIYDKLSSEYKSETAMWIIGAALI